MGSIEFMGSIERPVPRIFGELGGEAAQSGSRIEPLATFVGREGELTEMRAGIEAAMAALGAVTDGNPLVVDEMVRVLFPVLARHFLARVTAGRQVEGGEAANRTCRRNVFQREGEYWTIAYRGSLLRLRHGKGVGCIAQLLRYPGRDFHALDLVSLVNGREVPAIPLGVEHQAGLELPASHLGDAGEILDGEARASYKRRLEDLRDALAEAKSFNDDERASTLQEEIEFLAHELASGVGLGGRDRRAASAAERARLNVTRAIKTTVKRIGVHHRALEQHLRRSIRTGTFCAYLPDPTDPVRWEVVDAP